MSVCRKHRLQRRTSCACRVTTRPQSDGYGGPDVASVAVELLEGLGSSAYDSTSSSTYDSGPSSTSYHSGSSGGSYDSGSSSGGSDSW